jgi:hypothetical protein
MDSIRNRMKRNTKQMKITNSGRIKKKTVKPTHGEIIAFIEREGYGGEAINSNGNPTAETYEDAKQELIALETKRNKNQ